MAVHLRAVVRVGKYQRFGDRRNRHVAGEQPDIGFLIRACHGEFRAAKRCARTKLTQRSAQLRHPFAADQLAPQNHMGVKILHHDQCLGLVEVVHLGGHARRALGLTHQCVVFEMGAIKRQRPALAHHAHIGQCLLDYHAAGAACHDKHQIEVAVAYFTDVPLGGVATHAAGDCLHTA